MKPHANPPRSRLAWYLIACGVSLFAVSTLMPPWNRVHLEMQEMLYGASREVSLLEAKPAGHRPWFMLPKAVEIGRNTVGNFYRFERIEYHIDWLDLGWQWSLAAALLIAGIVLRRRTFASCKALPVGEDSLDAARGTSSIPAA